MWYRGMYQEHSVFRQICVVLFIFILCTGFCMFPFLLLSVLAPDPLAASVVRTNLFIQDLFLFILAPVLMQLVLFRERFADTFSWYKAPVGVLLAGIAAILCLTPVIDWLGQWNSSLQLPESMAAIQFKLEQLEKSAEETLYYILDDKRLGILGLNLFIIAVLAPIGEELFFRGLLQKLLFRWTGRMHAAVWITAFLFSAIHLQFFGFVPRLLLGALLGYLCVYGRSLWVPIAAHIFNNALTLLILPGQSYNSSWKWIRPLQDMETSPLAVVASIVLTGLCMGFIYKVYRSKEKGNHA